MRIQIVLSREDLKDFSREAEKRHLTISAFGRILIKEFLEEEKKRYADIKISKND